MVGVPNITNKKLSVINQTNALTLTPYSQERKLLVLGNLWHKIIIHNVAEVDREEVLKALLNFVHPLDLIPIHYKIEGNNAHFIARNCGQAIEKLCRENLVVPNPKGQPYVLSIVLGFSNTGELKLNVQNNILSAIRKRFDEKSGTLDLDSFHKDPALNELIFCLLSQPKMLYFVLQLCKQFETKKLKLTNNELRNVPLEVLWSYCKSLSCLDVRFNLIENMSGLGSLKSMQIKELWLDGNPVCQNYDEAAYIQAVREVCPTVLRLDGVYLGSEGFLAYRRNFAVVHSSEMFVDQFLEHFFPLYDSIDRRCLQVLYHKNAVFSLSCSYNAGQVTSFTSKLDTYKRYSRNLFKMVDLSKTNEFLELGPYNIINRLCSLPSTEHDPYTFTVDVLEFTDKRVTLFVTGAFRQSVENLTDAESIYYFCRTFVLIAGQNGEYNIMNEMLHISNATTVLANRAFKMVKVTKPRALTSLKSAQTTPEKDEFVFFLSRITSLNNTWSKKCLEEAKWDLKGALEIFIDLYKSDKIPQYAFLRASPVELSPPEASRYPVVPSPQETSKSPVTPFLPEASIRPVAPSLPEAFRSPGAPSSLETSGTPVAPSPPKSTKSPVKDFGPPATRRVRRRVRRPRGGHMWVNVDIPVGVTPSPQETSKSPVTPLPPEASMRPVAPSLPEASRSPVKSSPPKAFGTPAASSSPVDKYRPRRRRRH